MENWPLQRKMALAIAVFAVPVLLLAYFLISEKGQLISFAQQEIAGTKQLRPAVSALGALTSGTPRKEKLGQALREFKQAETDTAGAFDTRQSAQAAMLAIQAALDGKDTAEAVGKVSALISDISDASNITLDPGADSYFTGDMIVTQATALLTQADNLRNAALALDKDKSDANKIAFAEARDGAAAAAASVATDLAKAIKANTDGSVRNALAPAGEEVAKAAGRLAAAAKMDAGASLSAPVESLNAAVSDLSFKAAGELEHLLDRRIGGFYSEVYLRLGVAAIFVILGAAIALMTVRSMTIPLGKIVGLMGSVTAGDLDFEIPQEKRRDEIGSLAIALGVFRDATADRNKAQAADREPCSRIQSKHDGHRDETYSADRPTHRFGGNTVGCSGTGDHPCGKRRQRVGGRRRKFGRGRDGGRTVERSHQGCR
jgi:HAMP domain-containing protein